MKCRILSFAPRLVATKKENAVHLRLLGEEAGILKELSLDASSSSSQALLGFLSSHFSGFSRSKSSNHFDPRSKRLASSSETLLSRYLVLKVYWVFVFLFGTKNTFPLFLVRNKEYADFKILNLC